MTGVGGLADQIQFIENGLFILAHHFDRPQPTPLPPIALRQVGDDVQQFHIAADGFFDTGPHHLDHHLPTVVQTGGMHLGNRSGSQWLKTEFFEKRFQRLAIGFFDDGSRLLAGKRRHSILQLGQFQGDIVRQQVATGGQHLPELDKDRSQIFQCQTDASAAR